MINTNDCLEKRVETIFDESFCHIMWIIRTFADGFCHAKAYDILRVQQTFYVQSPQESNERKLAIEMLLAQAHWPDTTVAQAQEAALALCHASAYRPKERNQSIQALLELTRRPDLSFEDAVVLDDERAVIGSTRALEQQQMAAKKQMWETIAQRTDLTSEQRAQVVSHEEFDRGERKGSS